MTEFRERPEFKRGRNGERIVAWLCKQSGWFVIPSYDYSGEEGNKAPKMEGAQVSHVLPDLDICKGGQRIWVEVKTKAKADWTRITQRLEHGISSRHYNQYLQIEQETGCPVYLVIFEENTGCILRGRLTNLEGRLSRMKKNGMDEGGMIFFARDSFAVMPIPEDIAA